MIKFDHEITKFATSMYNRNSTGKSLFYCILENYITDSYFEFKKNCYNLFDKKWITYIKRSFGGPKQVLGYPGRYTHRVAISNERILKFENEKVRFRYRDYQDGSKNKLMELDAFEFIRRFLLHVLSTTRITMSKSRTCILLNSSLPPKYFKIRYYALFSNRNKKKIKICREILGMPKTS